MPKFCPPFKNTDFTSLFSLLLKTSQILILMEPNCAPQKKKKKKKKKIKEKKKKKKKKKKKNWKIGQKWEVAIEGRFEKLMFFCM